MEENCGFELVLRELRNLCPYKGEPPCPQLQVSCFGQIFKTAPFPARFNTRVDETFNFPGLTASVSFLSTCDLTMTLYHLTDRGRTKLGDFSFSLSHVFQQENHKLKNKWCALVGTLDKVVGFVKISGRLWKTEEEEDEMNDDNEEEEAEVLGMPENLVQTCQLTIGVYKAENLPHYGVRNSISALISASLGKHTVRTRVIPDNTSPDWQERLLLPSQRPSTLQFIRIQVLNAGKNHADEEVDEVKVDLALVMAGRIPPAWFHCYTGKHKEKYAGRLLLSFALEPRNEPVARTERGQETEEPPLNRYKFWLSVPEVAGLDFKGTMKVRFECGTFAFDSQYEDSANRRWIWRERGHFPEATLELPTDGFQMPKLMLKVITHSIEQREVCVALLTLDTAVLLAAGSFQRAPAWHRLISVIDPSIKETKRELTGSIRYSANLIRNLRHSRKQFPEPDVRPSEIWVHVLQAKNILRIYESSLTEAFVQVSVCGVTKKTVGLKNSDNPQWNQLMKYRMHLEETGFPELWTDLWDVRPWPQDNELLGTVLIPPEDVSLGSAGNTKFPTPKYYDMVRNGEVTAKVLIGVTVYPLSSKEEKIRVVPQSNDSRKCTLQMLIIGTRKLKTLSPKTSVHPFVRVSAGADFAQETKGGVKQLSGSDNNHNILQTLEFPIELNKSPERAPSLVFRVLESSAYARSLIGTVEVDLATYLPWIPKLYKEPSPVPSSHHSSPLHASLPPSPSPEPSDLYGGFILDLSNIRKLNYHVDRNTIDVTDTTEALTADRALIPDEPRTWPNYIPENYSRPELSGPLDSQYRPSYDTFELRKLLPSGKMGKAGLLRCLIQISETRNKFPVSIEALKREIATASQLSLRLYILYAERIPLLPEDASLVIWCKTFEGDDKYQFRPQLLPLPGDRLELMTLVKVPITLPDHAFLLIELHICEGAALRLVGSTEIDVERRWFSRDFQEVRNPMDRKVPIERRRLETGDELVHRGDILLWMDILPNEEASKSLPERLIPTTPSPFVLRVVVWSVQSLSFPQPTSVRVVINVQDGSQVREELTDIHKGATDQAEFNWRCLFSIGLPSTTNSLQAILVSANTQRERIGLVTIDLAGFYMEVMKRETAGVLPKATFPLADASHELVGEIELEVSLLTPDEAEETPLGAGRSEPNKDPYLPLPKSGRDHGEVEEAIEKVKERVHRSKKQLQVLVAIAVCLLLLVSVPITLLALGLL